MGIVRPPLDKSVKLQSKMKTLTFILYFVAILGLIEANWRVTSHKNFSRSEKTHFLRYVRSAMSQRGGIDDKMEFLAIKMEEKHGNEWNCFYGHFGGAWRYYKSIKVRKGNNEILCFGQY